MPKEQTPREVAKEGKVGYLRGCLVGDLAFRRKALVNGPLHSLLSRLGL